jgi:Sulfotransferase family
MDLWTKTCENPVFVIGAPRSGTSIVAWSLVQHSSGFWASNESHILATLLNTGCVENAFERAKQTHKDGLLPQEGVEIQEFLQYLGLGINALFTSRSQGKRWIDHTPSYTRIVDTIAVMFPGASFIHILRDGREVVNSMTHFLDIPKNNLKQAPAWVDFTQACKTWRMYTRAAMDFCARHPERCLTVVYRELVSDPQVNFKKIQQFLRVPHDDAPVNYFTSQRINSSFKSSSQSSGDGRMRALNPCAEWSPKERLIFYWEAGPYLLEYGFATQEELDSLVAPN